MLFCLQLVSDSVTIMSNSLKILERFSTYIKAADWNASSDEVLVLLLGIPSVSEKDVLPLLLASSQSGLSLIF
jgi:hypothetical protein